MNVQAVILAAGRSSRFCTEHTKLSFTICGQEMIVYPVKLLNACNIPITMVIGYQKERVQEIIMRHQIDYVTFAEQVEQKGTGHALLCSKELWHKDHLLVMNGDMPLVTQDIIKKLIDIHINTDAAISFVAAHNTDPSLEGYGRVIQEDSHVKIVEARNFTGNPAQYCCVNAGIYLIKRSFLDQYLQTLTADITSGEFFITDLIKIASDTKLRIEIISAPFDLIRGVNTLKELWTAEHIKRSELINYWMDRGVRFSGAQNTYLDIDVEIGDGSFIGAGTLLVRGTRIGKNCHIDAFSFISKSIIHDNVIIKPHCVIEDAEILSGTKVGPFAHVHDSVYINEQAVIGNFVEVCRSTIGSQVKAKHLTYLGDSKIGDHVNIGAGTITCNYNGVCKNKTIIKDNASIGSNSSLVAPVTIGEGSITAAGSVITEDVPAEALAIARSRQVNKPEYAQRLRAKYCGATIHKQTISHP